MWLIASIQSNFYVARVKVLNPPIIKIHSNLDNSKLKGKEVLFDLYRGLRLIEVQVIEA